MQVALQPSDSRVVVDLVWLIDGDIRKVVPTLACVGPVKQFTLDLEASRQGS